MSWFYINGLGPQHTMIEFKNCA